MGGINPVAVEAMALTRGGRGRVVYMPTIDAEYRSNPGTPGKVPVSRNGQLLPEVHEVLKVMAKHNLGLSTGHVSPEEVVMLIRAAKAAGVNNIYVQHPNHSGARDVHGADEGGGPSGRADRDRAERGRPHGWRTQRSSMLRIQ